MSKNDFDWAGFWSSHKNYFDNLDAKYKAEEAEREEKYKGMTTREVMEARHKELMEQEKNKYHTALNDTLNTTLGGYGNETTQPLYQDSFVQSNSVFQPTNTDANNTFGVQNNMNNTGYQFNSGLSDTSPMSSTYTTPKPSFWDVAKDVGQMSIDRINPYNMQNFNSSEIIKPIPKQSNLEKECYNNFKDYRNAALSVRPYLNENRSIFNKINSSLSNLIPPSITIPVVGNILYGGYKDVQKRNTHNYDNAGHRLAATYVSRLGNNFERMGRYAGWLKEGVDLGKNLISDGTVSFNSKLDDTRKDLDNNEEGFYIGKEYPFISPAQIYQDFDYNKNQWCLPLQ